MESKFNQIDENSFVYKDDNSFFYKTEKYPGPVAIDMKPSKECQEYHQNSVIQINTKNKSLLKRLYEKHEDSPEL